LLVGSLLGLFDGLHVGRFDGLRVVGRHVGFAAEASENDLEVLPPLLEITGLRVGSVEGIDCVLDLQVHINVHSFCWGAVQLHLRPA
jgi:hypothetical protein